MKRIVACFGILLLTGIPLSMAETTDAVRIVEDPAGDLTFAETVDGPAPFGAMDLRYLDIQESDDAVGFIVGTQPINPATDQATIDVYFTHGDSEFQLEFQQRNLVFGWYWVYILSRYEPSTDAYSTIDQSQVSIPLKASSSEGWVQADIAREFLADRSGILPNAGREFTDIWVTSRGYSIPHQLTDRMPDEGVVPDPYVLTVGDLQVGDLRLWSASPNRFSNGEATTFIYEVNAANVGNEPIQARFAADDLPANWKVHFPTPSMTLDGGEQRTYPVLVQMPFAHKHGTTASVNITLASEEDGADDLGALQLTVTYHAVPQPAGHHSLLFLHSDASPDALTPATQAAGAVWNDLSMNTLEDDPGDDKVNVPGALVGEILWWNIPLSPTLQMGLDFDLEETGTISVPVTTDAVVPDVSLSGRLQAVWMSDTGERQTLLLAELPETQPQDVQGETWFETTIVPTAESDYVPYREGADLELILEARKEQPFTGSQVDKVWIMPGASLILPLDEYHDPVDDVFRSAQGVSMKAIGDQQKPVNPGEAVLFTVELDFDGPATSFDLLLEGEDATAALILGDARIMAGAGAPTAIDVVIRAPDDAEDGRFLDVVLLAQGVDDPDVQTLIRLVAEIDTKTDHPNFLYSNPEEKDSPGMGSVVSLAVVGVAVTLLRRRE